MVYGDDPKDPLGLNIYTPDTEAIYQSSNLYVYGMQDPVKYRDPTGNFVFVVPLVVTAPEWVPIAATAVGAVAAATAGWIAGTKIAETQKKATIDQKDRTAEDIISKDKKGSINREFPDQWRNKTLGEIEKAAKQGDKSAQKAKKLLEDKDFNKNSNSNRSKK